jgi:hypothetical protein
MQCGCPNHKTKSQSVSLEEGFVAFLAFDNAYGAGALQIAAHGHLHHLDSFVRADPRPRESLGLEGTTRT